MNFFLSLCSQAHLTANLIVLIPVSIYLERRVGWLRIGAIFLLSGLGGNAFSQLVDRTLLGITCETTTGASGAVYGLAGR